MRGTKTVQQIRRVQFEKLYEAWKAKRMTQREAAELLGMNEEDVSSLRCSLRVRGRRRDQRQAHRQSFPTQGFCGGDKGA